MTESAVPTLYDWLGGLPALLRLTERFYQRVKDDELLAPVFAHMNGEHPAHVAAFLGEVLGARPLTPPRMAAIRTWCAST